MTTRFVVMLAVFAMTCADVSAQGRAVLKKYPLYASDVVPILEVARLFVGPDGKVVHDKVGGQLLVLTTEDKHAQLAEALAQINIEPRNVRLDVVFSRAGASSEGSAKVNVSGKVHMGQGRTHSQVQIMPDFSNRSTVSSGGNMQSVTVSSGKSASIDVLQEVPFATWILEFGRHYGYIAKDVEVKVIGTSLRIEPHVIGNGPMIRLCLVPEVRTLVGGEVKRIRYERVVTEVLARNGQPIQIGGSASSNESFNRFLTGSDRSGNHYCVSITATPTILAPSGNPVE